MKFSAAAFTILSFGHSFVHGVIQNPPSLRGGAGGAGAQRDAATQQYPQFPAPGHQRGRRLEEGGFIVLFEDSVDDVDDFAIKLSNSLGRHPDYIMKNTVHGVYMSGLSDADVELLNTVEGVAFIEQNHFVDLFEGAPQQQQQQQLQQDQVVQEEIVDEENKDERVLKRRRRRRKKVVSSPVPAPVRSPTRNPPVQAPVQAPTPARNPNGQALPWNIARVKGGVTYTGTNKVYILDTGIMLNHPDLNVDRVNAYNVFTGTNAANDDK
jgi:hypothetical protein